MSSPNGVFGDHSNEDKVPASRTNSTSSVWRQERAKLKSFTKSSSVVPFDNNDSGGGGNDSDKDSDFENPIKGKRKAGNKLTTSTKKQQKSNRNPSIAGLGIGLHTRGKDGIRPSSGVKDKSLQCPIDGCKRGKTWGFSDGSPEFCNQHKLEGMVLKHGACQEEGCNSHWGYRFAGDADDGSKYCGKHKKPGMVPRKQQRNPQTARKEPCWDKTCNTRASKVPSVENPKRQFSCHKHAPSDWIRIPTAAARRTHQAAPPASNDPSSYIF